MAEAEEAARMEQAYPVSGETKPDESDGADASEAATEPKPVDLPSVKCSGSIRFGSPILVAWAEKYRNYMMFSWPTRLMIVTTQAVMYFTDGPVRSSFEQWAYEETSAKIVEAALAEASKPAEENSKATEPAAGGKATAPAAFDHDSSEAHQSARMPLVTFGAPALGPPMPGTAGSTSSNDSEASDRDRALARGCIELLLSAPDEGKTFLEPGSEHAAHREDGAGARAARVIAQASLSVESLPSIRGFVGLDRIVKVRSLALDGAESVDDHLKEVGEREAAGAVAQAAGEQSGEQAASEGEEQKEEEGQGDAPSSGAGSGGMARPASFYVQADDEEGGAVLHEAVSPANVRAGVDASRRDARDVYLDLRGGETVALRLYTVEEAARFASVVRGAATASRLHAESAAAATAAAAGTGAGADEASAEHDRAVQEALAEGGDEGEGGEMPGDGGARGLLRVPSLREGEDKAEGAEGVDDIGTQVDVQEQPEGSGEQQEAEGAGEQQEAGVQEGTGGEEPAAEQQQGEQQESKEEEGSAGEGQEEQEGSEVQKDGEQGQAQAAGAAESPDGAASSSSTSAPRTRGRAEHEQAKASASDASAEADGSGDEPSTSTGTDGTTSQKGAGAAAAAAGAGGAQDGQGQTDEGQTDEGNQEVKAEAEAEAAPVKEQAQHAAPAEMAALYADPSKADEEQGQSAAEAQPSEAKKEEEKEAKEEEKPAPKEAAPQSAPVAGSVRKVEQHEEASSQAPADAGGCCCVVS